MKRVATADQCLERIGPGPSIVQVANQGGSGIPVAPPRYTRENGKGKIRIAPGMVVGMGPKIVFERRERQVDMEGKVSIIVGTMLTLSVKSRIFQNTVEE
jgi:hypothetical protein